MAPATTAQKDDVLIELAVAGDAECFALLIERHKAALRKCIGYFMRDGADADDLLQDILLKLWLRLSTFRSESTFRTWMTRVAINEILQFHRRSQYRRTHFELGDPDAFPSAADCPYRTFARDEAQKAIHKAVADLPEIYRDVLVLRDLQQLTTEETAQSLRSSVPAVKSRLFRARGMLSSALRGSGVLPLSIARPLHQTGPV
jgi:RNA polymerase sigma-70 factor (ECF subfamily)